MDPEEKFVCMTVTRAQIANYLNGVIEVRGNLIKKFTPNDSRLSEEFCQSVAEGISDIVCDLDELSIARDEFFTDIVRDMINDMIAEHLKR